MRDGVVPLGACCILLAAACWDDASGPRIPSQVILLGGDAQTGIVGEELSLPLSVRVVDAARRPVSGIAVTFVAGAAAGSVVPTAAVTDANGAAASRWTLPISAGHHSVWARVPALDSVAFSATAAAAGPAALAVVSGDSQPALVSAPLDSPVVVRVRDAFDNPVPGASVSFRVVAGGGTVAPASAATDSAGIARAQWTLGDVEGVQSLTATVAALPPQAVTALAFPPLPAQRLSVAYRHGCWLAPGGAAYCWGDNARYQLGDGTGATAHGLVPVAGGVTFAAIATGSSIGAATAHTCGVAADSTVYCWGTTPYLSSAIPAPLGGAPRLVAVTVGSRHACGITPDGTAYCWGANENGQLGDGGTSGRATPAPVAGSLRFRQIAAGDLHTCGITRRGALLCWGDNLNSQIGNGTTGTDQLVPAAIAPTVRFSFVSASAVHSCALALVGGLYCWGNDGRGQVTAGAGSGAPVLTPRLVATTPGFTAIGLGYEHTCGLVANGDASCWGRNYEFALGDSAYGVRSTPASVLGNERFLIVEGGLMATCGITVADALHCWGTNFAGAVGQSDSTQRFAPVTVVGEPAFTRITSGLWHSCGLTTSGAARCWGAHVFGSVGDGTNIPRAYPVAVSGGLTFASLDAGGYGTCGVTSGGVGYCWGRGEGGEIGNGDFANRNVPTPLGGGLTLAGVSVGFEQACGLTTGGAVWCWGRGDAGGATPTYGLPVPVSGPEAFTQVSAGWRLNCALGVSGGAYCWMPRADSVSPAAVAVGGGLTFTEIQAGNQYACGLMGDGQAYCWGLNTFGQLGDATNTEQATPVPVTGALTFTSLGVSSDGTTTCGVSGGVASCWGRNEFGQLGIGVAGGASTAPTLVAGGLAFAAVSPSAIHTCGLGPFGEAYCWGTGTFGELGNGATWAFPAPVRVEVR